MLFFVVVVSSLNIWARITSNISVAKISGVALCFQGVAGLPLRLMEEKRRWRSFTESGLIRGLHHEVSLVSAIAPVVTACRYGVAPNHQPLSTHMVLVFKT